MSDLAASVEHALQHEARQNALRLAQVRMAALLVATALDAAFYYFPRQTIGVDYVSPANPLLAGFWLVVAVAVGAALRARWDSPVLRFLLVVLDPMVVLSLFIVIFHSLRDTEKVMHPVVVTAAAFTLFAVTGALRLSARAAGVSGLLSILCFAVVAAMIGYSLAEALFVCGIIGAAGLLGMRLAENTRRAVQAEANRVILRRLLPSPLTDSDPQVAIASLTRPRSVEATILVSDLRGFTASVEKLTAQEALVFLNKLQGRLAECVRVHGGSVDKFMGDGMLAAFGAFNPLRNHAEAALNAAADIRVAIAELNSGSDMQAAPVRIGVGVHSGPVVVGSIGSGERLELTVIGDTVNTASRLEAATKDHGVDILVSEDTRSHLKNDRHELLPVGDITLRGRSSTLRAYRLGE